MDSETLKQYEEETNEYIKKKKIDKLFDVILKNVLMNKPENIYMYIYNNIYSFLLNKIFIIGPPLLKITSTLSAKIATTFNYDYISTYHLVNLYISENESSNKEKKEEEEYNKVIVNDALLSYLVKNAIESVNSKEKRGYVVDGYPRNNLQAQKCIHFVPSHVIILYAEENYIYKKYEEENNFHIFSKKPQNTSLIGIETYADIYTDPNKKSKKNEGTSEDNNAKLEYVSPPVFEVKKIDPKPLRDKVKAYCRNITGILGVFEALKDKKKVFNLAEVTEQMLIQNVESIIEKDKDKWSGLLE